MEENLNPNKLSNSLLDGLGFELRTLLNGFSGPVHLLKYQIDDPELAEIFRMFDSTLSRLERLALRSSIVTSLERNTFTLKKDIVNIVDIARYSLLEMQNLAELENIHLKIVGNYPNISIFGNHELLLQVFQVLFEAAISLSSENTEVLIQFSEEDQGVVCTIFSPTATFSKEMNPEFDEKTSFDQLPWDMILTKRILSLHDAEIKVLEIDNVFNTFEITFKTV